MAIQLDLSSLDKVLQDLTEALQAIAAKPRNSLYRDACIQRFKFCYALFHKMLKRYLELASPNLYERLILNFYITDTDLFNSRKMLSKK